MTGTKERRRDKRTHVCIFLLWKKALYNKLVELLQCFDGTITVIIVILTIKRRIIKMIMIEKGKRKSVFTFYQVRQVQGREEPAGSLDIGSYTMGLV